MMFVCDRFSTETGLQPPKDPFSYTQCYGQPASDTIRADSDYLETCLKQYNNYVHTVVPDDFLLDIDLFSSIWMAKNDPNASAVWSNHYEAILANFLGH